MKKKLILSGLAAIMIFNTGCEPEQMDTALDVLTIAVGIAAIASVADGGGHHDNNHGGGGRDHGNGGGRGGGDHSGPRRYDLTINESFRMDPVQSFALRHNISSKQAIQISNAFTSAKTQGVDAFSNIGLNKGDLKDLMNKQLPDSRGIARVANKLDLSEARARDLMQEMVEDFTASANDVNSDYWAACTAKGSWKTQATSSCTSLSAEGCSPATGASLCY